MRIRLATPDDYTAWLPLWQGYQQFYKTRISREVTERTLRRFADPAESMHCALAKIEGSVVGMVHYIYRRSCWTASDYCYLQDLFTTPARRGQGIGGALIPHVYDTAAQQGATRVWWLTHETNTDAMHLYDKVADKSGFVQYRKMLG